MGDIDLVIFDCDGVLVDSEPISAAVLIDAMRPLGADVTASYVYARLVGQKFESVRARLEADFDVVLPDRFEHTYREALRRAFSVDLKATPGIGEVVSQLGVAYCVATSSSPTRAAFTLEQTGLAHWFGGRVFTASEVARGKPAPDLFLHAAAQMGVEAAKCLVVEDSIAGVTGGLAAGMTVWRYTGGGHLSGDASLDGDTPADVLVFDAWDGFFQRAPGLKRQH